MSWDIVSKAAETVITNAIIGITKLVPLLPLSPGPDTEGDGPENGGGGDAPTAPEVPGQPSPTPPPPAPPVPPEGAEGPAAEAAKEEARRVGEMLEQLVELDSAGISAEEVAAAGEVGRQRGDRRPDRPGHRFCAAAHETWGRFAGQVFQRDRLQRTGAQIQGRIQDSDVQEAQGQPRQVFRNLSARENP